jgi:peptide/nickel transport system permease protein/dipeptide transport system permease protein
MLSDSRAYIESAPWLVTLPGLCILVIVIGFNLLGDGLNDALDPKMKRN